jgi:teichuronic acid biosynthesis glycosyltransferase TuaG
MYEKYCKRIIDIVLAVALTIVFLPLGIIISVLIKIDSAGPIIFRQQRYGRNKQPFTVYKFRSMTNDAPHEKATNELTESSVYITRIGKILRKLSIDELPQILNILKGDMSFVGPRPVILSEKSLIRERDKYGANECRPGVSGWAQVNGRDYLNDKQKARYDGEYAQNIRLSMDVKCFFTTILIVIARRGHREGGSEHNQTTQMRPAHFLVSIIVPVHNAAKYLDDTINTVLNQTHRNWELIFVDDLSTDASVDIIKHYQSQDERIKLLTNTKNLGAATSRNRGINTAHGDYIAFLDADDLWVADKIEKQLIFMLQGNHAFTFTGYGFANSHGIPNGKNVKMPDKISYWQAIKNTIIRTSTVMLDVRLVPKEQIQMPDVRYGEDVATWWQLLRVIKHAHSINETMAYYRRTPNSLSANKFKVARNIWHLYREVERVPLLYGIYCYSHSMARALAKRL